MIRGCGRDTDSLPPSHLNDVTMNVRQGQNYSTNANGSISLKGVSLAYGVAMRIAGLLTGRLLLKYRF